MTEWILDKLNKISFQQWHRDAERYHGLATRHTEAYVPFHGCTFELEKPHRVIAVDLHGELNDNARLSEDVAVGFAAWIAQAPAGHRVWMVSVLETHIYLTFWLKQSERVESESYIMLNKAHALEQLLDSAYQQGLLFTGPVFETGKTNGQTVRSALPSRRAARNR